MDKSLGKNMDTYITLKETELMEYINKKFQENALIEISYNRVFVPGKLLYVSENSIILQLKGQLLNQVVEINIEEIKDEIVEIRHTNDNKTTIITVIN